MTPRWLSLLVRLLPADAREEVLRELVEQRRRILDKKGRVAMWRWAWRQPLAVLAWRDAPPGGGAFAGLAHDVVSAHRTARRRPAWALTVIATIAIAVGATAAVTGILDAVVFRPLPFPAADRLVWLASHQTDTGDPPFDRQRAAGSYANPMDVVDWQRRERHFTAITPFETFDGTILAGDRPLRVAMASVGSNVEQLLGIRAQYGRLFQAADAEPGTRSIVMTHRLWRSAFGADPQLVGRRVDVGGDLYEVNGILPDLPLNFPTDESDVWFVLRPPAADFKNRGGVWQRVVARVDPGVSLDVAGDDMTRIASELAGEFPDSNKGRRVWVVPYREGRVGATSQVLWLLGVAVALVLVIACANIGHLLLVNAQGRQREMALRAALGARPGRLARLLLVESALLATIGGALGVLISPWFLRSFLQLYPETLPSVGVVSLSWLALAVAAVTTMVTGCVAVIPSLLSNSRQQLQHALRAGERGLNPAGHRRLRSALVVTQVAVSTALLIGGGLLVRTFLNMRGVDVGFAPEDVLTFNVAVGDARYPKLADEVRFQDALLERIRVMPGVRAAGASTLLPFAPGEFGDGFYRVGFNDVYPKIPIARLQVVTPGYFEAVGLRLRQGRAFSAADVAGAQPVVIVNEALERRDFPAGALGRQIRFRGVIADVIGVVATKQHRSLREVPRAEMFYPRAQVAHPRYLAWFAVRADGQPEALTGAIRDALKAIDPAVALDSVSPLTTRIDRALAPDRFRASLIGSLAIVALLLAGLGLYGLVADAVSRDAREIAVRMALGATGSDAVTRTVSHVLLLTGAGAAAGGALAYAGHTLVTGFLSGVTAFDPLTVGIVVGLLVLVAAVASAGPAARASRVDPATALRS